MPNLVLIAQAVGESGYAVRHFSLLLRKGLAKGQKVGRIWLVGPDDLRRYAQEMEEKGTQKFDPTRARLSPYDMTRDGE